MQFDEFIQQVDAAIRAGGAAVERFEAPADRPAEWVRGRRSAAVAPLAPRNVSVALTGNADRTDTTWYPVDAALVPVVARRIAGFLSES